MSLLNKIYIAIFIVAIFLIVILPIPLYVYNTSVKLTQAVFKVLPYPVAIIDGKNIVTTRSLFKDTETIRRFYESQDFASTGLRVDFSTPDGEMRLKIKEKEVLDKLIEDIVVKKIAEERGIDVTIEEAHKDVVSLAKESGSIETFEQNLNKLYGWNLEQFKKKVVVSQLFLKKLIDYYVDQEEKESDDWKRIQEAKNSLSEDGSNFCEIVNNYSEGETAKNCGEVGWFEEKHLEPEVAKVAFNLKVGEVSHVIKSSLGYHIIFLEEIRQIEKDGEKIDEVNLKQIFIANGGFVEWIKEEKKEHRVWVLIKNYSWDKNSASVKFRDNQLEIKEEKLRSKSEGDPIFY